VLIYCLKGDSLKCMYSGSMFSVIYFPLPGLHLHRVQSMTLEKSSSKFLFILVYTIFEVGCFQSLHFSPFFDLHMIALGFFVFVHDFVNSRFST
jgi:hypothetical protein